MTHAPATPDARLYTRAFFLMAAANLCSSSCFACFYLFPLFIRAHGGDETEIGLMMGAMSLASVVFRPYISLLVDRVGRRKSYLIGAVLQTSLSLAYLGFMDGVMADLRYPLFAVRVVHGVAVAFCFTAGYTYITDIIPPPRINEGIGMYGVAGLSGMALGPALGEWVVDWTGFEGLYVTASAFGLLAFLCQFSLPESYSLPGKSEGPSFMAILFRPRIRRIAFLALLFGVGLAGYGGFVAPYGEALNLPFVTLYFVGYSAAAIGTRLFGGRLADRVGEERIIPWALFLTGTGLLLLVFLKSTWFLLVSGLVTGTGHGFLFPSLSVLSLRGEPIGIRGKINGIYTGGIDAGILFGSVFLGWAGDLAGFPAIFFIAGGALWLGLLFFLFQVRPKLEPRFPGRLGA